MGFIMITKYKYLGKIMNCQIANCDDTKIFNTKKYKIAIEFIF